MHEIGTWRCSQCPRDTGSNPSPSWCSFGTKSRTAPDSKRATPSRAIQHVAASIVEVLGDHLVFLDAAGRLAAVFLLNPVESWEVLPGLDDGLSGGYGFPLFLRVPRFPAADRARCQ